MSDQLVPDDQRHIFHLTVCVISAKERSDAMLDVLDAIRELEIVEGFAVEREDYSGYVCVAKTQGLPSFSHRIPESWLEE